MTTGAEWGEQLRRLVDGARGLLADPGRIGEGAGHSTECRWCPLCQALAVVRGERPEASAALADLLTTTASALRTFADSHTASAPPAEADGPEDTAEPPPEVQRIEIA